MSCALAVLAPAPLAFAETGPVREAVRAAPGTSRLAAVHLPDARARGAEPTDATEGHRSGVSRDADPALPPTFGTVGTHRDHHGTDGSALPGAPTSLGPHSAGEGAGPPAATGELPRADGGPDDRPGSEAGQHASPAPGAVRGPGTPPSREGPGGGPVPAEQRGPYDRGADGGDRGSGDGGGLSSTFPPPAQGGAWSPAPVAPHDAHDAVAGAAEPVDGQPAAGDSPAPRTRPGVDAAPDAPDASAASDARAAAPVAPVLPLGFGLVSLGLGLAFLALRLRRG